MDMQDVSNLVIPEGTVRTIHDKLNTQLWGKTAYSVKYKGDADQQTTSGKNILPSNGLSTATSNGVVFTPFYDEKNELLYIEANGKAESVNARYDIGYVSFTQGESYTISGSTGGSYNTYRIWVNSASSGGAFPVGNRLESDDGAMTKTASADESNVLVYIQVISGITVTNQRFYPQIEKGSSSSSYEPYTNGKSPNPDYPQPVETATGPQSVTVLGKNLFKMKATADTVSQVEFTPHSDGTFDISGTADGNAEFKSEVIPLSESGIVGGQTYKISSTAPNDTNNITYYAHNCTANGTWVKTLLNFSGSSTKTAEEPTTDYVYFTIRVNNGKSVNFANVKTQVEVGTTASTFTAYRTPGTFAVNLGSTELCKIGTYQDYIYKSGDDWYVHKEIGKIILNGTNLNFFAQPSGNYGIFYSSKISDAANSNVLPIFSDHFHYSTQNETGRGYQYGSRLYLYYGNNNTTANEFKTWLGSNNTTAYYTLDTSVDTQIIDNTLINQLDMINVWLTRYGYNATVSGNLPIIIDRTTLS